MFPLILTVLHYLLEHPKVKGLEGFLRFVGFCSVFKGLVDLWDYRACRAYRVHQGFSGLSDMGAGLEDLES